MSLHASTVGDASKPVVVFLHGFMGSSLDWDSITRQLAADYYCICIDLPGHGLSVADDTYTFENVLMAMLTQLEELGVDRFALVGYSMGGRVALYLAQAMQDRVLGLVLESANPGIEDDAERGERLAQDLVLAERLEQEPFPIWLSEWYAQPLFASMQSRPELLRQVLASRAANDPFELARAMRGMSLGRQVNLWPMLPKFSFPILVIVGGLDEKYSALAERMETAGKVVVPQTGHNVHLENPEAYIMALSQFLSETLEG